MGFASVQNMRLVSLQTTSNFKSDKNAESDSGVSRIVLEVQEVGVKCQIWRFVNHDLHPLDSGNISRKRVLYSSDMPYTLTTTAKRQ